MRHARHVAPALYCRRPGVYTLSALAKYSADYDGDRMLLHSRWYDKKLVALGTTTTGPSLSFVLH